MRLTIIGLLFFSQVGMAKIKVVTSTTDLGWLLEQIGGDRVKVQSLLDGSEDPHYIDASPSFIQKVANADLVCSIGLDLEVGWMPKVLSRSGNAKVQKGGAGFCEASQGIQPLGKLTGAVDRSMGDVHPMGNPHFWLSPDAYLSSARHLTDILVGLDPKGAGSYEKNFAALKTTLKSVSKKIANQLKPWAQQKNLLIEYHKEFDYFLDHYGLQSFGAIEEKPGVAPSAGRIAKIALGAKRAGVRLVLAAETAPKSILDRFQEISGIPVVVVPASINPAKGIDSYPEHQEHIVKEILKGLNGHRT